MATPKPPRTVGNPSLPEYRRKDGLLIRSNLGDHRLALVILEVNMETGLARTARQ